MPLNVGKLANGLQKWMDSPQEDIKESAQLFADAYEDYAKGAIATSGGSIASYDKAGMLKVLTGITPPGGGSDLMGESIKVFWDGASVPPSDIIIPFSPPMLVAELKAIMSDHNSPTPIKANDMANAIHNSTTMIGTLNTTPSTPVPGNIA